MAYVNNGDTYQVLSGDTHEKKSLGVEMPTKSSATDCLNVLILKIYGLMV